MRILALAIAVAGIASVAPAQAQTYNPNFPVCMQVYGPINYYDCSYVSLAQCGLSASGRAAQCVLNPYLANAYQERPWPRYRR
jgi:hypothetical protein